MKTQNIKFMIIGMFLILSSVIHSQSDSGVTYYPDKISISFETGKVQTINWETGKAILVPNLTSVTDIDKLRFFSDSLLSVSSKLSSDREIKINDIKNISIKKGSHSLAGTFIGIGAGIIAGGIIGYAIGKASEDENVVKGWFYIDPGAIGAAIGVPIGIIFGGIIGNIIGGNIYSYETFEMKNNLTDKKFELERILMKDKRINPK